MTDDRRNRPIRRCQVRGCPHVGSWHVPFCPEHGVEARRTLAAMIERHRSITPPLPPDPIDVASDLLGGRA